MFLLRWGFIALLLSALFGCVTVTKPSSTTVVLQDSAPDEDVDVSGVEDAVPRHELIKVAGNKTPYTVLGKTYHVNFNTKGFTETGYASWYGKKFHGNKTSNGEIYDMYAMTAAHKTLAIPAYVKVTNLENGSSVVVRVNDRGPFHEGRIIDLSYAAAKKLGFHEKGTAKVRIEVIEPDLPPGAQLASATPAAPAVSAAPPVASIPSVTPSPAAAEGVAPVVQPPAQNIPQAYLQLGAFSKPESAADLSNKVAAAGMKAHVRPEPANNLYKVLVGPILDNFELLDLRKRLAEASLPEAHLVEY
ncbi:septal ring lytic transglycosylase RlpA family protein [Saccharophagus sp. K07]|jgi:rare lipoprotein A|uniref:septal ring lytic transglycosylase RlpA family protein n=1 Tax=Saccharophagus sp. K07 TaxID=2283636 RepID=UPI00165275B7|nr:septal ring lytic transglycosylase RlpA family protein [Saccharophagus sp. K07]